MQASVGIGEELAPPALTYIRYRPLLAWSGGCLPPSSLTLLTPPEDTFCREERPSTLIASSGESPKLNERTGGDADDRQMGRRPVVGSTGGSVSASLNAFPFCKDILRVARWFRHWFKKPTGSGVENPRSDRSAWACAARLIPGSAARGGSMPLRVAPLSGDLRTTRRRPDPVRSPHLQRQPQPRRPEGVCRREGPA